MELEYIDKIERNFFDLDDSALISDLGYDSSDIGRPIGRVSSRFDDIRSSEDIIMAAAIAYHDRVDSTITLDDASGLELYSNHDSSYVVVSEDNGQGRLRPVGTVYLNGKNLKAISKNMNKYDNNTPPRCNNGINDNKSSNSSSSSPSVPHARRLSFSSNSSGGSSAPSIYECVDGAMTKLMDTFTDGTCGSTCLSWTKHPCACINM